MAKLNIAVKEDAVAFKPEVGKEYHVNHVKQGVSSDGTDFVQVQLRGPDNRMGGLRLYVTAEEVRPKSLLGCFIQGMGDDPADWPGYDVKFLAYGRSSNVIAVHRNGATTESESATKPTK